MNMSQLAWGANQRPGRSTQRRSVTTRGTTATRNPRTHGESTRSASVVKTGPQRKPGVFSIWRPACRALTVDLRSLVALPEEKLNSEWGGGMRKVWIAALAAGVVLLSAETASATVFSIDIDGLIGTYNQQAATGPISYTLSSTLAPVLSGGLFTHLGFEIEGTFSQPDYPVPPGNDLGDVYLDVGVGLSPVPNFHLIDYMGTGNEARLVNTAIPPILNVTVVGNSFSYYLNGDFTPYWTTIPIGPVYAGLEVAAVQRPGASQPNALGTVTITSARVLVTDAFVPEPASWALMIGGLGLAGAALRQRRRPLAA